MAVRTGPPEDAEALQRVQARFFTAASSGKPTETQLALQDQLRQHVMDVAMVLEADVEPSAWREQALLALETVLMFGGKAIFAP